MPQYATLLPHYAAMSTWLDRVVVLWCNPHVAPPTVPANTSVPVLLERRSESLNEHFNVTSLVRTSSVLLVHDDLKVKANMMQKLLDTHRAEPHRIVGLDERCFNSRTGEYLGAGRGPYTMALTRTAIFSRRYLQLYMNDEALLRFVDGKYNGGEDIAINFLVHQGSGQWAKVLVGAGGRDELPAPDGLHSTVSKRDPKDKQWVAQRNRCVRWHIEHFSLFFICYTCLVSFVITTYTNIA